MRETENEDDLGFTFRVTKNDLVMISRNGKLITNLRANNAKKFLAKIETCSFSDQQQLMARVTGNYKQGNEQVASKHDRNRQY